MAEEIKFKTRIFSYMRDSIVNHTLCKQLKDAGFAYEPCTIWCDGNLPAPNAGELGEILPVEFIYKVSGEEFVCKWYSVKLPNGKWMIEVYDTDVGETMEEIINSNPPDRHWMKCLADTEADSRALFWLFLKQEKLIK